MSNNHPDYYVLDERNENPFFNMRFHNSEANAAPFRIRIKNRKKTHLIFNDSLNNNTLFIDVESCNDLHLDGVLFKDIQNANIVINVAKDSAISLYFCEISHFNVDLRIEINLLGIGVSSKINIGSVALEESVKKYYINVNHLAAKTTSNINLKGITNSLSKISFSPRSVIAFKTPNCEAYQDSRIINLGEKSQGSILPILEINNNDVKANHNAVLGSISENEVFYLLSRGMEYRLARSLVVKGIIMPIFEGLLNYEEKNKFMTVFDRGLN